MTGWVRLWHDMPSDLKWRTIAKRSGQRIGDVIAVFNFLMVNASANANERGRTHNLFADDIGAALDLEIQAVEAIFDAMRGKVWDKDGYLTGWENRQPKREDSSAERAKRWRDERKRTQANASERPDTETEYTTLAKANGVSENSDKEFWDSAKKYLGPKSGSLIGKWVRDHGKEATASAISAAQVERAVQPIEFIQGRFRNGSARGHPVVPL